MNAMSVPLPHASLEPSDLVSGFADPVDDAQRVFRGVLDAMANPGRIVTLPVAALGPVPGRLGRAAYAFGLALADFETPVWLDRAAQSAAATLRFHVNCPIADAPAEAAFALIGDPALMPEFDRFALGTDAYPDRSTTLVIEVAELEGGPAIILTGPGIETTRELRVAGLPERFWAARAELAELFPRGIDVVFTSGDRLAAVPRTTVALPATAQTEPAKAQTKEVPDVRRG
jgi:alpha-D-ribose 1-methylphosphonate 5-triphosphate synthase subunit PhnH